MKYWCCRKWLAKLMTKGCGCESSSAWQLKDILSFMEVWGKHYYAASELCPICHSEVLTKDAFVPCCIFNTPLNPLSSFSAWAVVPEASPSSTSVRPVRIMT